MSAARLVDLAWRGRVAVVTLDNPATLNAMDDALGPRLVGALEALGPLGARAAVLTGAGGNFSAGGNLKKAREFLAAHPDRGAGEVFAAYTPWVGRVLTAMERLPCPLVAAVEGAASGAGLAWIAACDLAVVAADARLLPGFLAIGLTPAAGATVNLPRALGLARAGELLLANRPLAVEDALRLGLVNRVVAPGRARAAALALAGELARQPREALLASRRLLRRGLGPDYAPRLEDERQAVIAAADRPEFRERVMRFGRKKK